MSIQYKIGFSRWGSTVISTASVNVPHHLNTDLVRLSFNKKLDGEELQTVFRKIETWADLEYPDWQLGEMSWSLNE